MRSQVRDLGATRELLAHHLSDLDDILAALRIRNGAFPSAHSSFLALYRVVKDGFLLRTTVHVPTHELTMNSIHKDKGPVCRLSHTALNFCGQKHTVPPLHHEADVPAAACEPDTRRTLKTQFSEDDQLFVTVNISKFSQNCCRAGGQEGFCAAGGRGATHLGRGARPDGRRGGAAVQGACDAEACRF